MERTAACIVEAHGFILLDAVKPSISHGISIFVFLDDIPDPSNSHHWTSGPGFMARPAFKKTATDICQTVRHGRKITPKGILLFASFTKGSSVNFLSCSDEVACQQY
jgi:hypothetical protein